MGAWTITDIVLFVIFMMCVLAFGNSIGYGWLGTWVRGLRNAVRIAELDTEDRRNNDAINRIGSARTNRTFPAVPPAVGPSSGRGMQYYYDAEGRCIGWEEVQWPYEGPTSVVAPNNPPAAAAS